MDAAGSQVKEECRQYGMLRDTILGFFCVWLWFLCLLFVFVLCVCRFFWFCYVLVGWFCSL